MSGRVLFINVSNGKTIRETLIDGEIIKIKYSIFIVLACKNGKILLVDPTSLNVKHTFDGHSGGISDLDVHGNYMVTCGYSNR
jgi:PAB-dependent poly(A)-specific ribonuclease subunit 2